jgi:tetratricopeptide (TPR) repeat protein
LLASEHLTDEDRAAALANRGEAHRRAGDSTAALLDYSAAIALDDGNVRATAGRARVLIDSGQLDAAEPLVERLIASGATGAGAHFMQGQIAAQRGQYDLAISAFDAALEEDRQDVRALSSRARMKLAQGDAAGAMADFDAAVRMDPHFADARAGRCWLALRQRPDAPEGDDQAREDAETAVSQAPQNFDAQTCLGILQLRAEEWSGALRSFNAALALDPGSPMALFGRGVARRRGGDGAGVTDMNQARDFDHHIGETFAQLGVATY